LLKLAKYLKPFIPFFIFAVAALFLQAFCDLSLPNLMSRLVDGLLSQGASINSSVANSSIIAMGLQMLGIALTGGAAAITVSFLSTRIAAGIARDIRAAVFEKVETFSSREFDAFSTASLITRCTNDVTQVQQLFATGIRMAGYAPIMAIGGIIMALHKAPGMAWIIALAAIVLICMVVVLITTVMPKFKVIQNLIDRLNRITRETLNGLMVIRAFGAQDHEKKRFDSVNKDLTNVTLFVNRVMIIQQPGMQFIQNSAILAIIWIGAHRVAASGMGVGDMMAFIQYTIQIISSFLLFSSMFITLPRTQVSAERIAQVLNAEVSIRDPEKPYSSARTPGGISPNGNEIAPNAGEMPPVRGARVEFKNVSFRYSDAGKDVLSNISFTVESGQTTAIIGATGSGKSTIVNLIMRFYDVTGGSVKIDGVDVREFTQESLRSRIGYVPQKSMLLSGPVSFNLSYGKTDATAEEIREAAEIAQALDFIEDRGGFETALAQGAANVSGGQKQRLSIARALARDAELLIFDDSFSALDFATDARLRRALEEKRKEVTKIIVAQRVGTISQADKIIVLEKGRITGMGTHEELMKTCQDYREIAESQIPAESQITAESQNHAEAAS